MLIHGVEVFRIESELIRCTKSCDTNTKTSILADDCIRLGMQETECTDGLCRHVHQFCGIPEFFDISKARKIYLCKITRFMRSKFNLATRIDADNIRIRSMPETINEPTHNTTEV